MAENEAPAPDTAATPDAPPALETPQDIAEVFKGAFREAGEQEGISLLPETRKRGRGARAAEPAPLPVDVAPTWTPDGIGRVVASGHDMVFKAFDLPELEDDERKQVETQSARFLNAVWPSGATYEPHAAFALTEASVIVPRLAAYQLRKKQEAEKAEAERVAGKVSDKSVNP